MINRFDRLRHHSIVCCHDQDNDIGDFGATTSHGGKGFVARRVQERHLFSAYRNRVGADMLRNPTGLAFRHLRLPDGIKQRGLAVIDMAHDRHDRWPRLKLDLLLRLHDGIQQLFSGLLRRHIDLDPVLLRNDHGCINVHGLIEREHLAHIHQLAHDVGRALSHQLGKLLHRHAGRKLEALPPWLSHFPRRAVMHVLAAVVTALLHRNGTKILPASRILTKPKLFFFPVVTSLLGTTASLTAVVGAGAVVVPIEYGWSGVTVRSICATAGVSACGCTAAGGLTTRVSMCAPLLRADSTVGRDAASSAGTSSALLRLIRMRRLSDLEDSSAAGAAWTDPALAPVAWSDAIPTLPRSPRPASAS